MSVKPGTDAHGSVAPSAWVMRFAKNIRPNGLVLDLASGHGRHAAWLEAQGHRVVAADRDADALTHCVASEKIFADLESGRGDAWPFAERRFDAIVVTNYLHRPLFAAIVAALAEGGVLIYETFADGNAQYGRPNNPDFLLRRGELLEHCEALRVVAYEDGIVAEPKRAAIQRICAIRCALDGEAFHPIL